MVVPIVASICRELFLSVPNELEEGALCARRDALGDGAGRRAPLVAPRDRGCGDPGPWPRDRRGDRRHAGDRRGGRSSRRSSPPATRWRAGSPASTRGPSRRCRSRRSSTSAAILLVIGLVTNFLAQLVVRRFVPRRVATDGLAGAIDLTRRGGRTRRRRLVNRLAELSPLLAALAAVAVLGIVVWSVAKRAPRAFARLPDERPAVVRPAGRRDRAADRRLRDPGRHRAP